MFEAAKLVRPPKGPDGIRPNSKPAVDRTDRDNQRFVISLSEGETIYMCHPVTKEPGYFVVFKLDRPQTIHFIHHWDARASKAHNNVPAREDIPVPASLLKELGPSDDESPYKVFVNPLGNIRPLKHD